MKVPGCARARKKKKPETGNGVRRTKTEEIDRGRREGEL